MEQINCDRKNDGGAENRAYIRSQSDHHLPTSKEDDKMKIKRLPRTASAEASTFPVIYEVPIDIINAETAGTPYIPPPPSSSLSAPSTMYNHHAKRQSTALKPFERQLSLIDPMSDRVSTILVWKNITVQIREDKRKEAFQRMKSYKNFVPKRKCLLHNVSGAITGGLWAVMGKFSSSI
jgi:hypothetical protein